MEQLLPTLYNKKQEVGLQLILADIPIKRNAKISRTFIDFQKILKIVQFCHYFFYCKELLSLAIQHVEAD